MAWHPLSRPALPSRRKLLSGLLGFAFLAVWVFFLWPASLGGRTSYVVVHGTSMRPGLHTGDLVLTRERSSYHVGDVVAFHIDGGEVIHRLHSGSDSTGFTTKGDNRTEADPWTIQDTAIVGEEWLRVPGVGRMFAGAHNPVTIVLVLAALIVLGTKTTPSKRDRGTDDATHDEVPESVPSPQT
jgi:signal peptidase I